MLSDRWERFCEAPVADRPALYQTPTHGRNIHTQVGKLPTLASVKKGHPAPTISAYAWRSFDRQLTFGDPRFAKTESPSLWASVSPKQVFLCAPMTMETSAGPVLVASSAVPDKHYFRGSFGGKDILPLYRDSAAKQPNITIGLPDHIEKALALSAEPSAEDIAAYVYALLSAGRYQQRFAEALQTPGPRVPITRSANLWKEAVEVGRTLLWLHTYAERYQDAAAKRGPRVPRVAGLVWANPVTKMPETPNDIDYDTATSTLIVGAGRVAGVRREVWEYKVSGLEVVYKWLGYRTKRGAGRAASSENPLDRIRPQTWPSEWNEELLDLLCVLTMTVDIHPRQAVLLDAICDGPLIPGDELPEPEAWQKRVPDVVAPTALFPDRG